MQRIIGQKEYKKFKKGQPLTYSQACSAHCYVCNGFEAGGDDCGCDDCCLYQFMPYRKRLRKDKNEAWRA